ncbi:MAG: hypothetical protein LH472_12950 [Pyrinomonadaceae bacterium]|nr:hypothetical protein [Pyrinomonadaceae bacterium]
MFKFRLISLSLVMVCAFVSVFPQTADKNEEKQKQQNALLEQIIKDANGLRLPENRALVLAKLGDGFWAKDEKRARQFFQTAVNELVAAQTEAEAEKKQAGNLYGLIYGTSPRQEILMMIAGRDAEFALDAFYKSRPAKIAQALAAANGAEKKDSEARQYAQNEAIFEQGLINKFSEQNPQRALKLFRESLAKGVTYEAINLIEKLKTKDLELANQIAAEVADKLAATDFEKDAQAASLTVSFVGEYGKKPDPNQKMIKIDDKVLRDLTAKVVKNILKSDEGGYEIEYILPIVEKFAPESLAALKQKKAKFDKENKREDYDAFNKLIEGNPSPEKLLSEADKYPDDLKNQIYYAAAEKTAQSGNVEGAKKIISARLPENERENYLTQINYNLISQAMTAEKYDEAALLINQIPAENSRFYYLMQLATTVYQKKPAENKRQALNFIEQARALIPQPAETLEDISLLMQIAATLADIEPEQSFQILESLTFQMNEFLEAAAIVGKYRSEGTVRKGEMIVNSYGSVNGLNNMAQILATLKKKDFGRTTVFVNGFQRLEVRVSLEMQLIENPAPTLDAPASGGSGSGVSVGKSGN